MGAIDQEMVLPEFARTIASVRLTLKYLGLATEFEKLTRTWDESVVAFDFSGFGACLDSFIPSVLRAVAQSHPGVGKDLTQTTDEALLLRLAVQGIKTDEEAAATGWYADDAFAYLSGDLESLHEYKNRDNLVRYGEDELYLGEDGELAFAPMAEPIEFWTILFELDAFLTGLLDTRIRIGGPM